MADETKHSKFIKRLVEMSSQGSAGKLKAESYLQNMLKSEEKKARKKKRIESEKHRNERDNKRLKATAALLFNLKSPDNIHKSLPKNAKVCSSIPPNPPVDSTTSPGMTSTSQNVTVTANPFVSDVCTTVVPASVPSDIPSTITSSVSSSMLPIPDTVPSSTCSDSVLAVLSSHVCAGCGRQGTECHERKYRNICFHAVFDYFEDVGFPYVDRFKMQTVYVKAYSFALKKDLLEKYGFYERNREIDVPSCMLTGSYHEIKGISFYSPSYRYVLSKRMYEVECQHATNEKKAIGPSKEEVDGV